MSRIRYRLGILLLVCILASCHQRQKQIVIGVSQCSEDNWREKLIEELRLSTYYYDNVSIDVASSKDDDKKQIEQIEDFIRKKVDLLIVSPNQVHTITPVIDKAFDSGIPVLLFDRKTDSRKYSAFVGADNYEVGRTMGEYIAKRLDGRGRIVEITGLVGSSPAMERQRGFHDAIARYPGLQIVASVPADWLENVAEQKMDSLLEGPLVGQQFNCVFGHNDRMAKGARKAALRHGIGREVFYAGVDALPNKGLGMEMVKSGELDASYIYPTRGDIVMETAMNILQKKPYQKDNYLKSALVTRENAALLLMQHEELRQEQEQLEKMRSRVDVYFTQYNNQKVFLALIIAIAVLAIGLVIYAYRTEHAKRRLTEASTQAKLQFFTNISHEFRTPLTLIIDPLDRLLTEGQLDEKQNKLLLTARRNAKVMLRLVGEILDFRKVQNGKMHVHITRFNLSECLREWAAQFAPAMESKGIALSVEVPEDLMVEQDEEKTERIVFNLLSNAMKYTPKGGSVSVKASQNGKDTIINVADTGRGIPEKEQAKVFDRFFQANNNVGGTGIGLALVKAFAELQGGSAGVSSEEGRGSTFTITLPVQPVAPVEEKAEDTQTIAPVPTENHVAQALTDGQEPEDKPVALIVEDNDEVRDYIVSLLSADYDIIEAPDGKIGLDKALRNVPDIVVSDVMMPVMDGLELCQHLKQETATSHIPVILLTARSLEDQRAEGYDVGADAYITKPFSGRVLIARVHNLIDSRRHLQQLYSHEAEEPSQQDAKPMDADRRFVKQLNEAMKLHLPEPDYNVEAMAADMNLSRVQFYRKVKALTGQTPVELLRTARLRRAEQLLRTTSQNVSEVAYQCGFSSPSYFSKCYKQLFGRLPGEK